MAQDEEGLPVRTCPYCGVVLERPYWAHVQANHPDEYEKHTTWVNLYKDYSSMGMDKNICLMVISELFNVSPETVESYLKDMEIL